MNVLDSLIEVKINEEEDFLKIKETLTRIGVASRKEKKLQFGIISFRINLDGLQLI